MTPASPEEKAFSDWKSNVYQSKDFKYESNKDMKREAFADLKPILDEVALTLGEDKFQVDTSALNDDKWFLKFCKEYVSPNGMPVLKPLAKPIIGTTSTVEVAGYVETKTFASKMKSIGFTMSEGKTDDIILYGANFKYPYKTAKQIATKENDNFVVILTTDTAWNALLWESYQTGDDPGNFDIEKPFPNNVYAPVTVTVWFKPSCEFVAPELKDLFGGFFN